MRRLRARPENFENFGEGASFFSKNILLNHVSDKPTSHDKGLEILTDWWRMPILGTRPRIY
jgi:hypothetical protein